MNEKLKNNMSSIVKDMQEVEGVTSITIYAGDIEIQFYDGYTRTGQELLKLQQILFNYKIFSFIKSEKVDFWSQELRSIKFYVEE